jgi:hypothetical protein
VIETGQPAIGGDAIENGGDTGVKVVEDVHGLDSLRGELLGRKWLARV